MDNFIYPNPDYEIRKERITQPKDNPNGFIAGDGQIITYEVSIKNTGDVPLTISVSDVFKNIDAFEFVDGALKQVTVAPGMTEKVTFTAKVSGNTLPGNYENTVTASTDFTYNDPKTGQQATVNGTNPGDPLYKTDDAVTPVIPTIWVSNTQDENQGGTVEVKGYDDTKSEVSSDGADNNNANRKPSNTVIGTAKDKWQVDVNNITVGIRGGEQVKVTGYDAQTGAFQVTDAAGNIIKGKIVLSNDKKSATVIIDGMDKDIDVGIPFIQKAESQKPDAIKVSIEAEKSLKGAALKKDQFSFQLIDGNNIQTKKNDANGKILFDELTFDKEGTYLFTLKEVNDKQDGITYDASTYTVAVNIMLNQGENVLTANVTYNQKEKAVFKNTYEKATMLDKNTPTDSKGASNNSLKTGIVKTGDAAPIFFFFTLMMGALAVMIMMGLKKKRLDKATKRKRYMRYS